MPAVTLEPSHFAVLGIFLIALVAIVLIWNNRQYLAGINTPHIEILVGKSIFWLVGIVIVTTIVTALLGVFGVVYPIRVLSAESLCYLAGAYALVRWGAKQ